MNEAIRLTNVSKSFQQKTAVNHLNFSINKGEIVAILGPNGAGKTTTISIILGLLKPSTGDIHILGQDPKNKTVREKIGVMMQEVSMMPGLKIHEILTLIRSYYPSPRSLKDLIELTGLTEQDLKTQAEKLSGGQKRRVSFALALAGNPDLIIFDEPTVGMDISSRNRFWQTIRALAKQGKTILFSTHYLQEADDAAQRILLFKDGKIVADGTPSEIKSKITNQTVSFSLDSDMSFEKLYQYPEIQQITRNNGRIYVNSTNADKVLAIIFQEKLGAHDIQIERGKLEDAFEQLTSTNKEVI
ncbi:MULTISPECIES: ABC transporter ATP-binding protein [Robertmurraya]|uniref:ABC transporter ATP-binding protein n=1 Tax=Robertmurraya beringensis TaxID=641660 RepID=A0ABV6KPY5_9BACI